MEPDDTMTSDSHTTEPDCHVWSVSAPHRSRIGLPYSFVLDGGMVVSTHLGITRHGAVRRAGNRVEKLQRTQRPSVRR